MSKLQVKVAKIGPEEARVMLMGHTNYRALSARRANAYAQLMRDGQWRLSILIVGENGELVDGATRLNAVISSGATQEFAIIEGWPTDSIVVLDNGQARTRQQVAQAERGIKNGNKVMATVVGIANPQSQGPILNLQALSLYDKHGQLAELVLSFLRPPLVAAVHAIPFARAIMRYPDREPEILSALVQLCDMNFSEPHMSGLRLYFSWAVTRGFVRGGGAARYEAYKRCARAIQAFLDDETLDKLYCPSSDPFADNNGDDDQE
jgi:hypothetical protein